LNETAITDQSQILNLIPALYQREESVFLPAFESLCLYFQDEHIRFIADFFQKQGDIRSLYWLVSYLVRIERPLGFEILYYLLLTGEERLQDQVCAAVREVSEEERVDFLIKAVDLPFRNVVRFAARELGALRRPRAVLPLLDVLEKETDKETRVRIIRALGRIRDPRAFRYLERLADLDDREIQEEAIAALSCFTLKLHVRYLRHYLFSPHWRVRQIAYQAALRRGGARSERYIVESLKNEKDEKLKIIFLSSLRFIATRRLFLAVFALAVSDPSPEVRMMAHSAFRRIRSGKMMDWLLKIEKRGAAAEMPFTLRSLAEYREEKKVFDVLAKNFLGSRENRLRLIALEVIGGLSDARATNFLLNVIRQNDVFSYAAANALVQNLREPRWELVLEVLNLEPGKSSPAIQAFLSFLLRLAPGTVFPEKIARTILGLSVSGERHLRLSAVRCLGRVPDARQAGRLLMIAGKDIDLAVRESALRGLCGILGEDSLLLEGMFPAALEDDALFPVAERVFGKLRNDRGGFRRGILVLLRWVSKYENAVPCFKGLCRGRLEALLSRYALNHSVFFLEILREENLAPGERRSLLKILSEMDIRYFEPEDLRSAGRAFCRAGKEEKFELLKFFKRVPPERSGGIQDVLFEALAAESDEKIRSGIGEIFSSWLCGLTGEVRVS